MTGRLTDKVIIATGAGSGIGRATSLKLAAEGALVAAADIDAESAKATVEMIEADGGQATAIEVDVTDSGSVKAMVAATVVAFGRLDGAFNNAGVGGPDGPIADHSESGWARVIAVNLTGVFLCLKHEIAYFQTEGRRGTIVNTSSAGGLMAVPTQAAYSASKHGVIGLTKTAAAEYGAIGVRVNAVCPGIVGTAGTKALIPEEVQATLLATIPARRMAEPAEVGDVVAYLLSEEASYLTGVALPVDGGHLVM